MLGLPDRFHAIVVLRCFRDRCRSRVTDVVVAPATARIAVVVVVGDVVGLLVCELVAVLVTVVVRVVTSQSWNEPCR